MTLSVKVYINSSEPIKYVLLRVIIQKVSLLRASPLSLSLSLSNTHTHTHAYAWDLIPKSPFYIHKARRERKKEKKGTLHESLQSQNEYKNENGKWH